MRGPLICRKCKKAIGPTEPIYRDSIIVRNPRWRSSSRFFFCACTKCVDPRSWQHWRETKCLGCGRTLFQLRDYHQVWFCSRACTLKAQTRRQKELRQARRPVLHCEICGREFEAVRSDAKTCGNRCRIALYRKSNRSAKKAIAR